MTKMKTLSKCNCPDDQCLLGKHPSCRWGQHYASQQTSQSSLEPRKSTVIITLDIPIVIIEEYPEEDTNYKGRLDWDFQNKNKFMIDLNDKIIKEIIEHKL